MPVDCDLHFIGTPDIEIIVMDTGGGAGSARVLDLAVHYDPRFVRYVSGGKKHLREGLLLWPRKKFPKNKGKLRFKLARWKPGTTRLTLSAVNPFKGKGRVKSVKVPKVFP